LIKNSEEAIKKYIQEYNKNNPEEKLSPQIIATADHTGNIGKTLNVMEDFYGEKTKDLYDFGQLNFIQNRSCFGSQSTQDFINKTSCFSVMAAQNL